MGQSLSGQFAAVNGVNGLRMWSINRTKPSSSAVSARGRGGRRRKPGVGSWNGSYTAEGAEPTVFPGQSFTFDGYTSPNDSVEGSTGVGYSGTAICNQLVLTFDQTANAFVNHQVSFVGHLGLTETAARAAIIDSTADDSMTTYGVVIKDGASTTLVEDWTTLTLTFTAQIPSFVNSSTGLETGHRTTSDIDWTLAVVVERSDTPLAEGLQVLDLRIDLGSPGYWGLQFARVSEYSGLTVDRQTQTIISQTLNMAMDSNRDDTGAIGQIVRPDTTVMWPPS